MITEIDRMEIAALVRRLRVRDSDCERAAELLEALALAPSAEGRRCGRYVACPLCANCPHDATIAGDQQVRR